MSLDWSPSRVLQVVDVLGTSTKPILAQTNDGLALVKYLGNRQGTDALIAEYLAAELAVFLEIEIPPYKIVDLPSLRSDAHLVETEPGHAFLSKWYNEATTFSPNSKLLTSVKNIEVVSQLIVFDTWIQNADRFSLHDQRSKSNYDNLLFIPSGKKLEIRVIDHTHAFVETSFDDEMNGDDWRQNREVFGYFPSFANFVDESRINVTLDKVASISTEQILEILERIPSDWLVSSNLKASIARNIEQRGKELGDWLPNMLFEQGQLNVRGS